MRGPHRAQRCRRPAPSGGVRRLGVTGRARSESRSSTSDAHEQSHRRPGVPAVERPAARRVRDGPHPRPQVASSGAPVVLTLDPHVPRGTVTLGGSPPSFGAQAWSAGRALVATTARHAAVERTSREPGTSSRVLRPEAVAASISHRCAIDLSPGHARSPGEPAAGFDPRRMVHRPQASRIGSSPTSASTSVACAGRIRRDRQVHRASSALGRVHDLQVLDVHVALAERRR